MCAQVAHAVQSTVIKAIPEDENAYVIVNDNAIRNGMLSDPIPLKPGQNEIRVVVTSTDGHRMGTSI
jgi:hypothetical protein